MSETDVFITSLGRTGTKWLAECLGWPHEPSSVKPRMVSPRHLQIVTLRKWKPPKNCKIIVITRDPNDQILSIMNRWLALNQPITNKDLWVDAKLKQLGTLSRFVSHGAKVIRYEEMIQGPEKLAELLDPYPVEWTEERFNSYPKLIRIISPWALPLRDRLRKEYMRWHQG